MGRSRCWKFKTTTAYTCPWLARAAQRLLSQTIALANMSKSISSFLLDAEKTFSKRIRSMSNIDHSRSDQRAEPESRSLKNTPAR
jgi:tryptophanyl-tRNA synthetase